MTAPGLLPTRRHVLANGHALRMASLGEGPPLVLLHGYPENLQVWHRMAPRLATAFAVHAFDWPGMGYSDPWPGGATPMHMADRLREVLDDLGIGKAVVAGSDMGGQPALVFAAKYPERVSGVVVMNSLVLGDRPTSWEIRLLRRFGFNRFALRRLPRVVFGRAVHTFLPRGARLDPDLRRDFWHAFRRPEVRRFISKMCAGYQGTLPRLPDFYASIRCPCLILWAERDKHFPPDQARSLHALLPGARLDILPGATHWMVLDRPDAVAERLLAWASSSDRRHM